jgi:hypothetical protein
MIYVASAPLQTIQDPRFFCQVWHFDRFLRSVGYCGLSSHFINTLDKCFHVIQIYTQASLGSSIGSSGNCVISFTSAHPPYGGIFPILGNSQYVASFIFLFSELSHIHT